MFKDSSTAPPERAAGGGLPHRCDELRRELLRRLALMEREVRALGDGRKDPPLLASLEILEEMERELRLRLALGGDPAAWPETRAGIVELWSRHRRVFERLAGERRLKFPARQGQRESGPRW